MRCGVGAKHSCGVTHQVGTGIDDSVVPEISALMPQAFVPSSLCRQQVQASTLRTPPGHDSNIRPLARVAGSSDTKT